MREQLLPNVRSLLRYLIGMLAGAGMASEELTALLINPELISLLALLIVELWYMAAKRLGWAT